VKNDYGPEEEARALTGLKEPVKYIYIYIYTYILEDLCVDGGVY
jgi:hypothetical protein